LQVVEAVAELELLMEQLVVLAVAETASMQEAAELQHKLEQAQLLFTGMQVGLVQHQLLRD
jgi:hypothetical protein